MSTRVHVTTATLVTIGLYVTDCPSCGVVYALTEDYEQRRREDHKGWVCPNGHSVIFKGKTDERRLAEERERTEKLEGALFESIIAAEQMRGTILRDRQRYAAGLCPCCRRSFDNVRRHMSSEHPDYTVQRVADLAKPAEVQCSCGRPFGTVHGLHIHQSRSRSRDWWKPETRPYLAHLTKV